ncbi:MAG: sigma-70 family RNA polymerase sigma factor [Nannocystaceae bacterium]|nr:sigma-70 family RNA polymerase sigma factor [Nannocystaceae bacterium]
MRTDFELLDSWRAGDNEAGNALFKRHFDSLVRFFYTKVNEPDVEDLIQRTLLGCVESSDRFRGDSSFRTYLFAVARNQLRMFWRGQQRSFIDLETQSAVDMGTSPSRVVARGEDHTLMLAALRRLSVDAQIALELHYWQGLDAAELAQVFDISPTTARTRMHRARVKLKAILQTLTDDATVQEQVLGGLETWARDIHRKLE